MTDKRYGSRRWKRVRLDVLRRDRHSCFVRSCGAWADACDHIVPVYPGMPDVQFYSADNLRASCRQHNLARGVAARLQRDLSDESEAPSHPFGNAPGGTLVAFTPKSKPRIG